MAGDCELPTCGDGIVHPGEECDGQDNCNHLRVRDRLVFATKDSHDGGLQFTGTLSGLEVADSACNSRANANGLNTEISKAVAATATNLEDDGERR